MTIKDCKSCIHIRICSHRDKNEEYKKQMKELVEEWGIDNPFGYTEDCPEWHENNDKITLDLDDGTISFGNEITLGNGYVVSPKEIKEALEKLKDIKYKPITKELKDTLYKNEKQSEDVDMESFNGDEIKNFTNELIRAFCKK